MTQDNYFLIHFKQEGKEKARNAPEWASDYLCKMKKGIKSKGEIRKIDYLGFTWLNPPLLVDIDYFWGKIISIRDAEPEEIPIHVPTDREVSFEH